MFWTRLQPSQHQSTLSSPLDLVNRFMQAMPSPRRPLADFPAFNLWANDDGAVLTSEVPGVRLEDLDISIAGKGVRIKGNRKHEEPGEKMSLVRRERASGEFERAFELPFTIEGSRVEASLRDGVLTITLPRAENEKPRKITVNG